MSKNGSWSSFLSNSTDSALRKLIERVDTRTGYCFHDPFCSLLFKLEWFNFLRLVVYKDPAYRGVFLYRLPLIHLVMAYLSP